MSSPMFEQYWELKSSQPDALLFFRMGDFYELFFEDAVVAAPLLEVALTSRNRNDPNPIPMAGVPHHAVASYIEKLTAAGHRVAIAEQIEDPSQAKKLVKRAIVRVVTPGVTYDPASLDAHHSARLAGVCRAQGGRYGLAFLDVSTGDLRVTTVSQLPHVVAELERMEPREVLLGPGVGRAELEEVLRGKTLSQVDAAVWRRQEALREISEILGVAGVQGFGVDPLDPCVQSAGATLRYARDQLGGTLSNVHRLRVYRPDGFMVIDETTRRNLELTRTLIGHRRRGSLLGLVDRTATPMGSRLLADWIAFPLLDLERIHLRQRAISALVEAADRRGVLREQLAKISDIERITARVAQGSANARDLSFLRASLEVLPTLLASLRDLDALEALIPSDPCTDLHQDLATWLVEEPPQSLTEGGMIRPEADEELAQLTKLSLDGVTVISELEEREREATKISTLKVKRNRVFGYFIEVTSAHLHKVPDRFLRKQTLSSCERYVTPELKELEEKVLGADERRKELEYERFVELRARLSEASARLLSLSARLSHLDVLVALAEVAVSERWVCPVVDDQLKIEIVGGRHPMVEAALDEERFVPNDVLLDPEVRRLVILTGPNMSGKSTVLRLTALIVLLAHVGSFVPAQSAHVGLCDRIFTRVGAADDLRRGQSTFMVEMSETAAILHNATARSLVVLDEIGRGTSTFDGLAIAWSVAEDLVDRISCRAMFATHYHELCELAELRPMVINQSVAITEVDGEILFLRRLKDGGASRSYGIQCARIAGLPVQVVERAQQLLARFEDRAPARERQQMALFAAGGSRDALEAPAKLESSQGAGSAGASRAELEDPRALGVQRTAEGGPEVDELRAALVALDPDELSPREAHAALCRLQELLTQEARSL